MSYNKNKELCSDLNNAAQPGDFSRYTGDDKESRQIRKEREATANVEGDKAFMQAIVVQQLG